MWLARRAKFNHIVSIVIIMRVTITVKEVFSGCRSNRLLRRTLYETTPYSKGGFTIYFYVVCVRGTRALVDVPSRVELEQAK